MIWSCISTALTGSGELLVQPDVNVNPLVLTTLIGGLACDRLGSTDPAVEYSEVSE
jgi:hypothetical protein